MVITKHIVANIISSNREQLVAYGVMRIGIFGSYVSGMATDDSDIDLLVDIKKEKKTFRNYMTLCYYLEGLLGPRVDLVTLQSLSPHIGPHILNSVEYVPISD